MNKDYDEIEIECLGCGEKLTTYVNIHTGDCYPHFCNDGCAVIYDHDNQLIYQRESKINKIVSRIKNGG